MPEARMAEPGTKWRRPRLCEDYLGLGQVLAEVLAQRQPLFLPGSYTASAASREARCIAHGTRRARLRCRCGALAVPGRSAGARCVDRRSAACSSGAALAGAVGASRFCRGFLL